MPAQLTVVANIGGVGRDGPVLAVTPTTTGCRPGYTGKEDPPGAPEVLEFAKTTTILKDLPEDQFRQAIAETMLPIRDLGLNRDLGQGEARAQAYLDMATWDEAFRKSWTNDNSLNSSSCGMVVRNIWWLCGLRGINLFDTAYKSGVLTELTHFDSKACKRWNSGFNAKTFFPKIGDALYLYDAKINSQHIFIICDIDKPIVDEGGVATVYDEVDGRRVPAKEITFTSVDGGQADGYGKDGNGKAKKWGCQGIQMVKRKMTLKDGHFMSIGTAWPIPGKASARPINTWISSLEVQDKFTAEWIKPIRHGAAGDGSAGGDTGGSTGGSAGGGTGGGAGTGTAPKNETGDSNIPASGETAAQRNSRYDAWMEQHHFLSMVDLLAALDRLGRTEVQAMRNRYVAADNPVKGKWGLRPQVAMDAVLHKQEGPTAAWIFDQLGFAKIYRETHPDQYRAVGDMIGLDPFPSDNVA